MRKFSRRKKITTAQCPICENNSEYEFSIHDLMFDGDVNYDYAYCFNCSLSFIYPMPSIKKIKGFYPDSYMVYKPPNEKKIKFLEKLCLHYKHGYNFLLKENFIYKALSLFLSPSIDAINYIKDGKFLDVGCGNGSRLLRMRQIGWNVTGVELNKLAVKRCHDVGLSVFNTTLENANFESKSFDVIYLSHLIEHVNNPRELINLSYNILTNNGLLYIKTPNRNSLGRMIFKKYWYANDVPRHLILYSKKSFQIIAQKSNFEIVRYVEFSSAKNFLNSLDYLLKRKNNSKRNKVLRALVKAFLFLAKVLRKGDESMYVLKKKTNIKN